MAAKVKIDPSYTEHATSSKRTDYRIKATTDARTDSYTTYSAVGDFPAETLKKVTKTTVLRSHSSVHII